MLRKVDIYKWGKLLILLTAVFFLLTACSTSDTGAGNGLEGEANELNSQGNSCWQGSVLTDLYNTIGALIMPQLDALTSGSMSVMMIGFAIWMALRLIKFVSSVKEDSPGQVWNEILQKAFICVFCGSLAYSSGTCLYVINTLLFPIYTAFLDFGSQILDLSTETIKQVRVMGTDVTFGETSISCKITGDIQATTGGFPTGFSDTMNCMICAVVDRMRLGREIAYQAMFMNGALQFFTGLLLWVIFYVVGFGFVFYLVDSIFRFGMMILLLPIFIMSYAFGPTKKWTKIGFVNIMNSAAFMMAFSIIIATALMAMVALINDNQNVFNPDNPQLHVANLSIATICLLLIGFLVFGSMGVSQQLTAAIIGGKTDAKFQEKLKAVGKMVLGWVTGGMTAVLENTAVGRAMNKGGALRAKLHHWAGRDE